MRQVSMLLVVSVIAASCSGGEDAANDTAAATNPSTTVASATSTTTTTTTTIALEAACDTILRVVQEQLLPLSEEFGGFGQKLQDFAIITDRSALQSLRDETTDFLDNVELGLTAAESAESELESADLLITVWESMRDNGEGLALTIDAGLQNDAEAMEQMVGTMQVLNDRLVASFEELASTLRSECPGLTAAPTTTATTAPLSSRAWSRVPHDEAVFGGAGIRFGEGTQSMRAVIVGGPGLVAVGSAGPVGGAEAAVWTSPDGVSWSRVPHDEAILGGTMSGVTVGGPGLVAVGSDGSGGDADAAVWTSPDGVSWSRVPHDEALFSGTMSGVTVGGPGLVAVGSDGSGGDADAAVWTSPDGVSWSRVPHNEAVFGGEGAQEMRSVTAGGPGLVAVGRDDSGGQLGPVVWTSRDGVSWSRVVPHDEALFSGMMLSVTAGGPGLVAVGFGALGSGAGAAVWTSPDGVSWSLVPHNEAVFGGEGAPSMWGVTAGGPGLVAVGFYDSESDVAGGDVDAVVWMSPDGVSWLRVSHDEAVFGGEGAQAMWSVTAGGPGLVAVGEERSGGFADAAVWVATKED